MPYSKPKKSVKEVRYLNKDFTSFKDNLIEFTKIYFPNEYNDFNESSPGMMFIEMASYVGDVLSYYIDNQFKESLLAFAEEKKTIYNMAQSLGYKPTLATAASVGLDIFQTVPATTSGVGGDFTTKPDLTYALNIKSGMEILSDSNVTFVTTEDCNFKFSSSYDPMQVSIYESSGDTPVTYLLQKSVKASSGNITTEYIQFSDAEKYKRIALANSNITEIISCTDSDGNSWYEVPFLAQDTVFTDMENLETNDDELYTYSDQAPYLLKLLKTSRRFTTFIREDGRTEMRFGAGTSDSPDEEIIPNPDEVGSSLPGSPSYLDTAFDPSNFLKTKAYGQAPSNTQLTIRYRYGGGVNHNVRANSIRQVQSSNTNLDDSGLSSALVSQTRNSVGINNPLPAAGGRGAESVIEVKNNALAYFQAQARAVTKQDYITRVYALPAKYGNISKAYIVQDTQLDSSSGANSDNRVINPLALNLYVLGFDAGKRLAVVNKAVKENIQTYLTQFRMVTDAVNIKDAFIINIGVQFSLLTKSGYNKQEVVLRAIQKVKDFFNIDKWQIGQPIVLSDLAYQISLTDGVSAVVPPEDNNPNGLPVLIGNKFQESEGYSGNVYDIVSATKDGIVYPSLDPSCFELKFPNADIEGRVVGDSAGSPGNSNGGSY
tara:strand:- start:29173 stop:31146 length:1974 start_codon:yes stop_codon:yes gene_type:complete